MIFYAFSEEGLSMRARPGPSVLLCLFPPEESPSSPGLDDGLLQSACVGPLLASYRWRRGGQQSFGGAVHASRFGHWGISSSAGGKSKVNQEDTGPACSRRVTNRLSRAASAGCITMILMPKACALTHRTIAFSTVTGTLSPRREGQRQHCPRSEHMIPFDPPATAGQVPHEAFPHAIRAPVLNGTLDRKP